MWIVTREINEYDQDGEYFVAAYVEKPTFLQLKELLDCGDAFTGKLLRGGGRQNVEDEWYNLAEIEDGKLFTGSNQQ